MKVVHGTANVERDPNSVVTVGSFDGVHIAHREIIRETVHRARMKEGRSVLVTFDPHPSMVVVRGKGPVSLLTTLDERIALIRELQIDLVCVIDFSSDFASLSSEEFYRSHVVDRIGVSEVVVGYDHMFGHGREAGVRELVGLGKRYDFSVYAAHQVRKEGATIGSTLIREMLGNGEVEDAAGLLGYSYRVAGTVVEGDGRGKSLGFPTANLVPDDRDKLIPGPGVYLIGASVGTEEFFGMLNVGRNPTMTDGERQTIEAHLFEIDRDLYGEKIQVTFLKRLRDEIRFGSKEELISQLNRDREESERLLPQFRRKQ